MTIKFYKGFEIVATPKLVTDSEHLTVIVAIRERTSTGMLDHHCHEMDETFLTDEQAVKAGLLYGEQFMESHGNQIGRQS